MRARTRLFLDIALLVGFVAAYRPTWTGITLHQWLSIAIIAPALVHLVVNWEWALRILRTFVKKLLSTSRLNFVVDSVLLLATVAVTVSGFMVSPGLIAPLGIHVMHPLEWHLVHSWTADATILVLLLHTALHWRWLLATTRRVFAPGEAASPRRTAVPSYGVAATMATAVARSSRNTRGRSANRGRGRSGGREGTRASRVGMRAEQAAAERATLWRTFSVMGLTAFLGFAIFTGVGIASPLFPDAGYPKTSAGKSAATLVCPSTGCKASSCHSGSGMSPAEFYKKTPAASAAKHATKKPKRRRTSIARVPSVHKHLPALAPIAPPKPKTTATAPAAAGAGVVAASASKATAKAAPKPAPKPAKKLRTCPKTGCQRSSCHADSGQSASSFY